MANRRLPDQTGKRFGKLVVLSEIREGQPRLQCVFRCDCGAEFMKSHGDVAVSVSRGHVPSCRQCHSRNNGKRCGDRFRTHGITRTKLYSVHRQMVQRCHNEIHRDYAGWGARGIRVCDEWRDRNVFIAWAHANGYRDGLTIERVNNNGNYEPGNCKWIPNADQAKNRRQRRKRESHSSPVSV